MTERVRGDVVAVFKLLLGLTPQRKIFTPPPPRRCASAAQPYTCLCVCSGSLLTRSKWNINSSCQVPGLHRVEVQRPISSSPTQTIMPLIMLYKFFFQVKNRPNFNKNLKKIKKNRLYSSFENFKDFNI